ncbi:MAG: hypothetical protein JSR82_23735 [Verrucomicrobia bacterium]|nr:hypothetical protein [Verrucomicrobiota bacterium]
MQEETFVNRWKNQDLGDEPLPRRRVEKVFVKEETRPKWAVLAGDMNDPSTWSDSNGYYDVEITGCNAYGFGPPTQQTTVRAGDIVRAAHAQLVWQIFATQNEHNPDLRKGRILGEVPRPPGGVLGFTIDRAPMPPSRKRPPTLPAAQAREALAGAAAALTKASEAFAPK